MRDKNKKIAFCLMSHKYGPAMLVVIASELGELCFYNPTRIPQRLPCSDLVQHSNVYEHLYILSLIAGKINLTRNASQTYLQMPKSNIRPQKIVIYGPNVIHIKIITSVRLYYKIWSLIKIWRLMIFTWTKIEHNIICYISGRSSVRATYFCQFIDIS